MRRANKLNAAYTLILGDDELSSGQAQLKNMTDSSQSLVILEDLAQELIGKLAGNSA